MKFLFYLLLYPLRLSISSYYATSESEFTENEPLLDENAQKSSSFYFKIV